MGIMEQASMMASLAKLKSAESEQDILAWFDSNEWVYGTVHQIISTISDKFGILSCDKVVSGDDITFTIHTKDSSKIYGGIRELVKGNLALLSKFKVKFTVDILNEEDIAVNLSVIPGKTDSFVALLSMIESGVRDIGNQKQ